LDGNSDSYSHHTFCLLVFESYRHLFSLLFLSIPFLSLADTHITPLLLCSSRLGDSSSMSAPDSRVETISRLVQWRIDTLGPCSCRRFMTIWNW
jgi:hypothetical protein